MENLISVWETWRGDLSPVAKTRLLGVIPYDVVVGPAIINREDSSTQMQLSHVLAISPP